VRTVPGIMLMDYMPSILNPIAYITPLKQEFTVPMSFIKGRIGKLTTALVYACLYDSAVPVSQPYVYTTKYELARHFKIDIEVIKHYMNTLYDKNIIFIETPLKVSDERVRNQRQDGYAVVYRLTCQVKPVFDNTSLIQNIKFKAKDMNKKDKMSLVLLAYLKEVQKLTGNSDIEMYPADIAKDLNRDYRRITRTLNNMDKHGVIEWQRKKHVNNSLIRLK